MPNLPGAKVAFSGAITAAKARIRLLRSFDQVSHAYQGYTLVLDSTIAGAATDTPLRIALGPKTHEEYRFIIGDRISGQAVPVSDPKTEWATHYKVSKLQRIGVGPPGQDVPANPEGGIAPPLDVYREHGHLRLDPRTYESSCTKCPWGLEMVTEITLDHWNPSKKKWRLETHCYGPRDCPRYKPGKPHQVPGRKAGMVWVDDDVERARDEEGYEAKGT